MALELEEQLLIAAIRESSARIPELIQKSGLESAYGNDIEFEPSEESVWADQSLEFALERLFIDLVVLAERLQLPQSARRIIAYRRSKINLLQLDRPEHDYFVSKVFLELMQYFDSVLFKIWICFRLKFFQILLSAFFEVQKTYKYYFNAVHFICFLKVLQFL